MSRSVTGKVLALDLGTTNAKAVLVDAARGEVLATASRRCAAEHGARSLQDPDALVAAAEAVVAELAPHGPSAVVLSSAMHGVLGVDRGGSATTWLSTWADAVGAEQLAMLRAEPARLRGLHERTGTPPHTSSWLCRVPALLASGEPGWRDAARFASAKELLLKRWCELDVVDASLASATGLFDARVGAWDAEALQRADVESSRLASVVPTTAVFHGWRPGVCERLGLPADLRLVVGATDGVLAHFGVGGDDPGVVSVTLGTSGAARRLGHASTSVASAGLFRYVLDGERTVVGGAVSNVGRAMEWAASVLFAELDPERAVPALLEAAGSARVDAELPVFDPRLGGERFPDYDAGDIARGAFAGLGYGHGRAELARAVVVGVVEPVARIVEALDERAAEAGGGAATSIRVGGGLARSALVGRLLATRLGRPLEVADSVESSAVGAVRLACMALGIDDGFRFSAAQVHEPG